MKNVALLRGINVGGHKKILMKDLRELLSKSQLLKNIETYIQSGNIVFESTIDNKEELEQEIYTYIYIRNIVLKFRFRFTQRTNGLFFLKTTLFYQKIHFI